MTDDNVIILIFYYTIILIILYFGWTGTPAAFQVITRALEYELKVALRGDVTMYADDMLIVTLKKHPAHDMKVTDTTCNNLMGPNSVETTKTESGRKLLCRNWHHGLRDTVVFAPT
jgi:hypothetical protein